MLRIKFMPTTKAPISMGTSKTATKPNSRISWPLCALLRRAVARLLRAIAPGAAAILIPAPN
jgi:hypothetical protein